MGASSDLDPNAASEGDEPADPAPSEPPLPSGPTDHRSRPLYDAAIAAERETGRPEETDEEARRSVIVRLARAIGGFLLIGVGIAALPLPGPGWLIIIVGLSILPYAWAERTIRTIRRRVPGIPEDGRIPPLAWVVMGVAVIGSVLIGIFLGDQIAGWISDTWESIWD
ncbi:MAG: PGPGW domain-containing protein [Acidimicrobiales bacterium]